MEGKADSSDLLSQQVLTVTKSVAVEKKEKQPKPEISFTKEQLLSAVKETQEKFCSGKNEYVLLAQVGLALRGKIGKKLHGKVVATIEEAFPNDFDIDKSKYGSERIRLK